MSEATADLIPAALRAQLPSLRISARLPPPAGPLGQNASRQRGQGLEFSQYRAYEPGDEPRHIDWKLFGRSDRYFVREAESEAGLALWLIVDASASMAQADVDRPERDKLSVARMLAAATLEIALREGDRFGLVLIGGDQPTWIPLGRGPRHRDRCALAITRASAEGQWPPTHALRSTWERIEPSSVVIFIGVGFDTAAGEFALQLSATRRDVRSLALTSVDERDFEMRGAFEFVDPETGARIEADAPGARERFRQQFSAARRSQQQRLQAGGVRSIEYVLDQPPELALRLLLAGSSGRGNR